MTHAATSACTSGGTSRAAPTMRTRLFTIALTFGMIAAAACNDGSGTAPRTSENSFLPDSAEQGAFGIEVMLTSNSVAKGRMLSDTMYTYEGGNRLELLGVNVTFFDSLGAQDGILTARRGTYSKRFNRLEAEGDVVVVREDGTRLETPRLVYDELRDQIFSDTTFVLNKPPSRQITGIGFESDPQLRQFKVLRNFKGVAPVTVETP